MRAVGLKVLKNKLSEYVRLVAGGETVLVTDRDRVVAELVPPREGRTAGGCGSQRLASTAPMASRRNSTPLTGSALERALAGAGARPWRPVIYLDTSVALAHLLAEDIRPPDEIWREVLVSSRLLEYELWVRLNGRKLVHSHADAARDLLGRVALLELVPTVLSRALEPFPSPVRTLDALHLASLEFLRENGHSVELLAYDERLLAAARRMKIPISAFGR